MSYEIVFIEKISSQSLWLENINVGYSVFCLLGVDKSYFINLLLGGKRMPSTMSRLPVSFVSEDAYASNENILCSI